MLIIVFSHPDLASKIVKAFPFSFINFKSQSVAQITKSRTNTIAWFAKLLAVTNQSGMGSEKVYG
jgi:hypothetical protein